MNIFINTIYMDDIAQGDGVEKRFPLIYFWLKDYYYQRSPENYVRVNDWSFSDDATPLRNNPELQKKLHRTPPDIVGLSLYLWNEDTLLDNAKWIKEHFPNCIIVAAGPNADTREPFMRKHTYIDVTVPGPAAETFRRIVDKQLQGESIQDVAGVCYWTGTQVIRNAPVPRKDDPLVLDYVTNFYDEVKALLDDYTQRYDKVIFLTMYMQGCPYSCSFCEQGTKLWTKVLKRDMHKLYKEVDLLATYTNCIYEFADANFGIVPEYEDIVDYVIENGKGNISFKKPPLAKNQIDFTNYLMTKMIDSGVYYSDDFGNITLQDPNPEIVKLNGRPFSKEYEKIKAFKEFTKDNEHKIGRVEIILGMPGQSYDTLTDSLYELQRNELLSHYLPYFYLVFPNTVLTSPGSTYKFKTNKCYVRSERHYTISMLDYPDTDCGLAFNKMIETETLSTSELAATWYHWSLMCHLYGFLGWMRTPINYLKNYHGIESHEFIKQYTSQFHPDNWANLPDSFSKDLVALERWLRGKDKLIDRYDNTGVYPLSPKRISQYRFHSNPEDFITILDNIFRCCIDVDSDTNIDSLYNWQLAKLLRIDNELKPRTNSIVDYNWDDISLCKSQSYWKSNWTFEWPTENPYIQTLDLNKIQFVPVTNWAELDVELQKELVPQPYQPIVLPSMQVDHQTPLQQVTP